MKRTLLSGDDSYVAAAKSRVRSLCIKPTKFTYNPNDNVVNLCGRVDVMNALASNHFLRTLDLQYVLLTDSDMEILMQSSFIESLVVLSDSLSNNKCRLLATNTHLTKLELFHEPSEAQVRELTQSTSLRTLTIHATVPCSSFRACLSMRALTELTTGQFNYALIPCYKPTNLPSVAFPSSSTLPSSLTSLCCYFPTFYFSADAARCVATRLPELRSFTACADYSALAPLASLPHLEHLDLYIHNPTFRNTFFPLGHVSALRAFAVRAPHSLTSLHLTSYEEDIPDGWGRSLASCASLTSLHLAFSTTVLADDVCALSSLSLTDLDLRFAQIGVDVLQAIAQIWTLKRVNLDNCKAGFSVDSGARALASLPQLEEISLHATLGRATEWGTFDPHTIERALGVFIRECSPSLTHLLTNIRIRDTEAEPLARLPSLTSLDIRENLLSNTTLATLLSRSPSLSHLKIHDAFAWEPHPDSVALQKFLHANVHLTETNLDGATPYLARNRRLLHNWQCICVLLASYRANAHSPIRDSILSLMHDVTCFVA